MTQAYSDPERESDPHALPDIEVFEVGKDGCAFGSDDPFLLEDGKPAEPGWYWWSCFPGCLPDGDPSGPFDTEEEALADARA